MYLLHRSFALLCMFAGTLLVTQAAVGQDTVFFTGFEYSEEPLVFEPLDLNGAIDQVGEWSGLEFPPSLGQFAPESIVFVDNPYGGRAMYFDRLAGDDGTIPERDNVENNSDFTGSFFAEFSDAVLLEGAEVSFDIASRRFSNNHSKSSSVIGRDSNGAESFHLRISTHNDDAGAGIRRRLGVVTDEGNTFTFDLPTVVGDDADNDLGGIGNAPHGVNDPIGSIRVSLGADGYRIDFAHNPQRNNANAYVTELIPYNGAAVDLARVEFTYEASHANGRNSATFLDNVLVTGRTELLLGDFNSDGAVDMADFQLLASNFHTGTDFSEGDNNFDGVVDLLDFAEFKEILLAQGAGMAAAVPEPSMALWGMFVVLLRFARRRPAN